MSTADFREKLRVLPRERLLEIIEQQNPELIKQIRRIEWVFENKMSHLSWNDGTQITGRPLTNEELALLVDEPFEVSAEFVRAGISPEEQRSLHIARDPVLWARHFLDARPRAYQILIMRHPMMRRVLRAGRRLGKALDVDTPIPTPAGWKTMGELETGDQVFDEFGKPCNVVGVTDFQYGRSCYEVRLSDQSTIIADAEHLWTVNVREDSESATLTTEEMVDSLKTEDEFNYSIETTGALEYPAKQLPVDPWVFGFWLANRTSDDAVVSVPDEGRDEILISIEAGGYGFSELSESTLKIEGLPSKLLPSFLKGIPEEYLQGSTSQREALLQGLMDAAGTVDDSRGTVRLCVEDDKLAEDAQELIQSLGYSVADKLTWAPWRPVFRLERKLKQQVLTDSPKSYRYIVAITPVESRPVKCIEVDSANNMYLAGKDFIATHNSWTMACLILHYSYTHKDGKTLVMAPMKSQVDVLYQEVLRLANNSEIVKESITRSITSPQFYIKFSNGSEVRFFTTGMRSGGRADVARGQEAHLIILDELDYMGPDDLDAIYVMLQKTDESQPEKLLIGASTPTGRREKFWQWCRNPRFKEFWFPSYVNPNFTIEAEKEFREEYTEMAYRHEIEADWGEDAEGVFPRKYVDMMFNSGLSVIDKENPSESELFQASDWPYLEERTSARSFHVIGVDWDKYGAGTNIVVLEMCGSDYEDERARGKMRVAYREEVLKEEYTLTAAIDRLIQLNKQFSPKHIYVDRGYGEVQVELLHKYGIEHPESGLKNKVKGVSFSETIEIRDPASHQKVKKDIKPFMVDNFRQFLEKNQVVAPSGDEELYLQIISYIVVRVTQNNRPIFEASGTQKDHALDALMLACLAITQNYGDLMKTRIARHAVVFSNEVLLPKEPEGSSDEDGSKSGDGSAMRRRSLSVPMGSKRRGTIKRESF